jgi:wyosine [tRNA(Phe)-imidazoG37] synthetase (radical SAM superfamily)
MQLLEPKNSIIYGPVNSRRLGKSLGINILPKKVKFCTFNCVYCHYGWTNFNAHSNILADGLSLPSVSEIEKALTDALENLKLINNLPAYITFSGNGEPTLHPDFAEIVDLVIDLRDMIAPGTKTAILSNSTEVNKNEITESLCRLDYRIMKLDCGTPQVFAEYNKPYNKVSLEKIVSGLENLSCKKPVYIQSLFSSGKSGNLSPENIEHWVEHLRRINPVMVQIYSLSRGYPEKEIEPARKEDLLNIHSLLIEKGINSMVF